MTTISETATVHPTAQIGSHCIIGPFVIIGARTRVHNFVELRANTVIGEDCEIDSYVVSSGDCRIGDGVVVRYQAIIARGCIICDNVYISPQVMTNNLNHLRVPVGGACIREKAFIGTQAVLAAGIEVAPGTVIGACSYVARSIKEPGTYVGVPARRIK